MFEEFIHNFAHNLFKPLLLFFYMGFLIPVLKVPFEFPKAVYQGLTLYLLVAIGWHGGEELASLSLAEFGQALGFMAIGFITNLSIGAIAYFILQRTTKLRQVDAATVAGFYGSDSAGTFVTCLGVITAANIAYAAYMPVMLAVMEIPGCLVALYLVSRLRQQGMDPQGNMPHESGYQPAVHSALAMEGADGGGEITVDEDIFHGMLCLFLLEMGITACRRLQDLKTAGWRFIMFGVLAPNVFAIIGILVAHGYSIVLGQPFDLGTYALFAVLCGAASYIAVPAVQRLAIPEASPTLPLAASLGLTFTYNVTIGIPVYMLVAQVVMKNFPVA